MSNGVTPQQQEAYLNQLRQQVQNQTIQEVMSKMSEKCFKSCAGKRGSHLDSSEANCVSMCMDRYMDTMQVVNQALVNRQNEH